MRKLERKHVWLIVGVVVACMLILYWLFEGTYLEENANGLQDVPALIESNNG